MSDLETLTFANFEPLNNTSWDIRSIGLCEGSGVAEEMSKAFGCELSFFPGPDISRLKEFVQKVGPAKTLQDNIEQVREILGTDNDAAQIARGWVDRSGLLTPVNRYFGIDCVPLREPNITIITGGVRNWMARRASRLLEEAPVSGPVLLVAGNREMSAREGDDVEAGMKEYDYLSTIVAPSLRTADMEVTCIEVESSHGDKVMDAAAAKVRELGQIEGGLIRVIGNAGNWVQNAGQFRAAAQRFNKRFDWTAYPQLSVISDSFLLGTGSEPTSTHQNRFTALGQIARNMLILGQHTRRIY